MPVLQYDPELNIFVRELLLMVFYLTLCTGYLIFPSATYFHRGDYTIFYYGDGFSQGFMWGSLTILILLCILMATLKCVHNRTCMKVAFLVMAFIVVNMFFIQRHHLTPPQHVTRDITFSYQATSFVLIILYFLAFTNFDFTSWKIYIWVFFILLIPLYFFLTLWCRIQFLLYTLYLTFTMVMVIQMLLSGTVVEIDEDDYALATFCVYTSVIHIYLLLLQKVGCIKATREEEG